jgi:Fic family protein
VSGIQSILAVFGALLALGAAAGGIWAAFRAAGQDATIRRQREDIAEYLSRIEYIEPRWKAADEQNTLLRDLHNPTSQLERIESTGRRTFELLEKQHAQLDEVAQELHRRRPRDDV